MSVFLCQFYIVVLILCYYYSIVACEALTTYMDLRHTNTVFID